MNICKKKMKSERDYKIRYMLIYACMLYMNW